MVDFGKHTETVDSVSVVPNFRTARELSNSFPALRTPVIEGLLRNGETLNIIAPPKTGKSWLVLDAALSIATGRPWMGCNTTPGKVLILDNELHGETMASRLPWVADARNIHFDEYADRLCVDSLRGRLTPLSQMNHYFARIESKEFQVIVLDAWYRFLEPGADENDNGSTTQMYNWLDRFAHNLGCCFVCIHHSTKGSQTGKSITDVGAGAGAQSRAADSHMVIREHEQEGCYVVDAVARSWPPPKPVVMRWTLPVWNAVVSLDPSRLRRPRTANQRNEKNRRDPKVQDILEILRRNKKAMGRAEIILELKADTKCSEKAANSIMKIAANDPRLGNTKSGANKPDAFVLLEAEMTVNEVSVSVPNPA